MLWNKIKNRLSLMKTGFLRNIPREFLTAETYHHSWFEEDTAYQIVYIDIFGRQWCKSWGTKKPGIPTRSFLKNQVCIDALGGGIWIREGRFFVCQFRV